MEHGEDSRKGKHLTREELVTSGFATVSYWEAMACMRLCAGYGKASFRCTQVGIFPTDFSSTMTATDGLVAIAGIATDPLRGVVLFVFPTGIGLRRRTSYQKVC